MGDPSGIGPEIIAKALTKLKARAEFVVVGDKWVFDKNKKLNIVYQNCNFVDLKNVSHKKHWEKSR